MSSSVTDPRVDPTSSAFYTLGDGTKAASATEVLEQGYAQYRWFRWTFFSPAITDVRVAHQLPAKLKRP
jgi:phosphopantothenoylcysteine synthetase/decarboxylase